MRPVSRLGGVTLWGALSLAACLGGSGLPAGSGATSSGTPAGTGGGASTGVGGGTGVGGAGGSTAGTGGSGGVGTGGGGGMIAGTGGSGGVGAGGSGGVGTGGSGGAGTGGGGVVGDPSCEVLTFFERKCWNCHGTKPHADSGLSLVTYADLTAPSDEDPSKTNAERSMITMQDPADPMPPGVSPWATPDELAALQAWIDAGYPTAVCGELAKDPYAAPPSCSSGLVIDPNGEEGEEMTPGHACNDCHQQQNSEMGAHAPIYHFAGTVYPSAHEPDDCAGLSAAGAFVEVVDANGQVFVAPVNAVGNFFFEDPSHTFKYPYKARVVFQGRERWMDTPETDGDCNRCHSQAGIENAPGRILLP